MLECQEMYTEHKDESGLSGTIKLDMYDGLYLEVYLWNDLEAMYTGTKFRGDYAARYVSLPYKIRALDGHKIIGPKYGEIHMELGNIGGGIFAHELQHFVLDYIDTYELDFAGEDNERICLLVGNMTADFWSQFYEMYRG